MSNICKASSGGWPNVVVSGTKSYFFSTSVYGQFSIDYRGWWKVGIQEVELGRRRIIWGRMEGISGEESLGEKSLGEKSLGGGLKTRLKLPCKSVNSSCYQRWFTWSPCSPLLVCNQAQRDAGNVIQNTLSKTATEFCLSMQCTLLW